MESSPWPYRLPALKSGVCQGNGGDFPKADISHTQSWTLDKAGKVTLLSLPKLQVGNDAKHKRRVHKQQQDTHHQFGEETESERIETILSQKKSLPWTQTARNRDDSAEQSQSIPPPPRQACCSSATPAWRRADMLQDSWVVTILAVFCVAEGTSLQGLVPWGGAPPPKQVHSVSVKVYWHCHPEQGLALFENAFHHCT